MRLAFMDVCWFFTAVCSVGSVVWVPALLRQMRIACGRQCYVLVLLTCYCYPSSGEDAKSVSSSALNQGLVLDWVGINFHV